MLNIHHSLGMHRSVNSSAIVSLTMFVNDIIYFYNLYESAFV